MLGDAHASNSFRMLRIVALLLCYIWILFIPADAQQPMQKADLHRQMSKILKSGTGLLWFEQNAGQFPNTDLHYACRTAFGSMGVYSDKVRIAVNQYKNGKVCGMQVVDIRFTGSRNKWHTEPSIPSTTTGSYQKEEGTISPRLFQELTLRDIYPGIDLRLYTGDHGALEFDWLVQHASDYKQIGMQFTGQDKLLLDKSGNLVLKLRRQDLRLVIPETYQVLGGNKVKIDAAMRIAERTNTLNYELPRLADPDAPLVIDPVMIWSTYMHNNTNTFDEYLYAIAVNNKSEVYACGITNESLGTAYLSNIQPGYSGNYISSQNAYGKPQTSVLYRLNASGTAITAWTYTGLTTNIPVAMGIFPDGRVLVAYQKDTVQIFSADLNMRQYSGIISPALSGSISAYQSLSIVNDDIFYLGGVATTALPASIVPASAPDETLAGQEGVIIRITDASTLPAARWGTYIGGSGNETFTAIAVTPDKSKLAFAVHINSAGNGYPALVNEIDNRIAGSELMVGYFEEGEATRFGQLSFFGGSSDEGKQARGSNAALVAADNDYYYVAGNTSSSDLPGTAGSAQPSHGPNTSVSDQFLLQIPYRLSGPGDFNATYCGGEAADIVGGLVIDLRTRDVLLFGTTESLNFPVNNGAGYSPFYQASHGNTTGGPLDMTYSVFANGLSSRKFSTYIGGSHNDYLGSTGKLQGTGHFQYCTLTGLTYIGTTIHSDQTTLPTQWMSAIPGFDKEIPIATTSKDNHYIFAMNPNTYDFGDAPASYDSLNPASSSVAGYKLGIGTDIDPEDKPNNSLLANGDDVQNYGSPDDEDGIAALPSIKINDTTYKVNVAVFNNTGAEIFLYGWIDTDGNGRFDSYEHGSVEVASTPGMQTVELNFTGLPPFRGVKAYTYLRLRLCNESLSAADARGQFGYGEVEDHMVLQSLVLPLHITTFSAEWQHEDARISWTVEGEEADAHIILEHSTDGTTFRPIHDISATTTGNNVFLHASPDPGKHYYRLVRLSASGMKQYSEVRLLNKTAKTSMTVYPNPVGNTLNLYSQGIQEGSNLLTEIFSLSGNRLLSQIVHQTLGPVSLTVAQLPSGVYVLKVSARGDTKILKFVKK